MKHSILILAHKDFTLLRRLIDYFSKECCVYVHIDKKANISEEELMSIESMPQVCAVYRHYSVHWGGFSVLESELFLLKNAYKGSSADYYHLISGQDYPIKPLDVFLNFFEREGGRDYIEFKPYPISHWSSSFFDRYKYYYLADDVNWQTRKGKVFMNDLLKVQTKHGINRPPIQEFDVIYKGSQWMSLSQESVKEVLRYSEKHPSFLQRLKYTFAPEESYIHTILLNGPNENVQNNNLRYIRWYSENGNNPSNLGLEHFGDIQKSDAFFARKMERPYCIPLLAAIDTHILNNK